MDKENKLPYSFRIEPELKEKLRETAEKKGISEGTIIRRALKNYFQNNDPYDFLTCLSHFPVHEKAGAFYEIMQREFEKAVMGFHTDVWEIISGKGQTKFVEWLRNQPVFVQKRFRDTDDPEEAADIITRFKESNPSVKSAPSKD